MLWITPLTLRRLPRQTFQPRSSTRSLPVRTKRTNYGARLLSTICALWRLLDPLHWNDN